MSTSRKTNEIVLEVLGEWSEENGVPWESVVRLFDELSYVEGNSSFKQSIQALADLVRNRR